MSQTHQRLRDGRMFASQGPFLNLKGTLQQQTRLIPIALLTLPFRQLYEGQRNEWMVGIDSRLLNREGAFKPTLGATDVSQGAFCQSDLIQISSHLRIVAPIAPFVDIQSSL